MTLRARLSKLERDRPKPSPQKIWVLDLPDDICARVDALEAAGRYPQDLSEDDVNSIMRAAHAAGWRT